MNTLRPAQRMLAQGVVASTQQLVRAMRDRQAPGAVQGMMQERRRLLTELARNVNTPGEVGSLAALVAAVAESDRTLGALIGQSVGVHAADEAGMYEGVDTVILNNELAYEDLLPVAFKPLARPLDAAAAAALADRNVRLLQVCATIEEQGNLERSKDDASSGSQDMIRLEVKVNLLLDLMGQLLAAQVPRPRPSMVRFNAMAAVWKTLDPPHVGAQGLLEIWLRESVPQPLTLIANVTHSSPEGQVKATLTPPGDAVADLIEKLSFRRHRRHVAGARQPPLRK